MTSHPTTVQENALRTAIENGRIGCATEYADRTLETMRRNGWVTRPDSYTYRVTPDAAKILGQFTLSDRYQREDLLATNPMAQRQAAVINQAREAGISTFAQAGTVDTVSISVEDLSRLLAASRAPAYAA